MSASSRRQKRAATWCAACDPFYAQPRPGARCRECLRRLARHRARRDGPARGDA